jgi:hypothetical protein
MSEISTNLLQFIGTAASASLDELVTNKLHLSKLIGTGYYEGRGDELLQHAVDFLGKLIAKREEEAAAHLVKKCWNCQIRPATRDDGTCGSRDCTD